VSDPHGDRDRWHRPFYAFVTIGMVLAFVLGVFQVIDKPVVRLSDVRATWDDGAVPRAQVLARNASDSTTYCIEITFTAVDTDGLTLESVVGQPTTGAASLRPGGSANFAAEFTKLTETEIHEELDDVLAFVTGREAC
jgi:hypothetical protein